MSCGISLIEVILCSTFFSPTDWLVCRQSRGCWKRTDQPQTWMIFQMSHWETWNQESGIPSIPSQGALCETGFGQEESTSDHWFGSWTLYSWLVLFSSGETQQGKYGLLFTWYAYISGCFTFSCPTLHRRMSPVRWFLWKTSVTIPTSDSSLYFLFHFLLPNSFLRLFVWAVLFSGLLWQFFLPDYSTNYLEKK